MALTLCYWNIRGLAAPIRYLLHYAGVPYEDKQLVRRTGADKSNWMEVKYTLGLDFPNLPYLIDGDVKLTQSLCIMRYLARKHGLVGQNEVETATLDMLEQQAFEMLHDLNRLTYRPDFADIVGAYVSSIPDKLTPISKFLGDKKYLLGDRLTYVDFYLYEAIDQHRLFVGSCLDQFENLREYMKRIEALPAISKYMKSAEFKHWPLFSDRANFGGKGQYPMFK